MPKIRDITGQRFGNLVAIKPCGANYDGLVWLCQCDCGNQKAVARGALTNKRGTRSCGCLVTHEDLTGQKFGKLTVIREYGTTPDGKFLWECECECGKSSVVRGTYLKSGHTKTCGECFKNEYTLFPEDGYAIGTTARGIDFVVDIEDLEKVRPVLWRYTEPQGYIQGTIKRKNVYMHTFLLNPGKGQFVDHINRNKQDNRRKSNLRLTNHQGNSANTGLQKNNKSGAKGVDALPNGRFEARIGYNHKKIWLGSFTTIEEAEQAYDNAARFYFGEHACTNEMLRAESKNTEVLVYAR